MTTAERIRALLTAATADEVSANAAYDAALAQLRAASKDPRALTNAERDFADYFLAKLQAKASPGPDWIDVLTQAARKSGCLGRLSFHDLKAMADAIRVALDGEMKP